MLREIRGAGGVAGRFDPDLPIIVLSGRGTEADRVRGLSEGADDYLVKPFHYAELVARMRAVLRRRRGLREGPRRIGELVIDVATRRATLGGEPLELSAKEFTLLSVLARDPSVSSPSRSCCATSGAIARWAGPARSTRTRAGCGRSSAAPATTATSSTAGASATG